MAGFPRGVTFQAGGKPSIHHPSRAICEDVLVNCQAGNRHSGSGMGLAGLPG